MVSYCRDFAETDRRDKEPLEHPHEEKISKKGIRTAVPYSTQPAQQQQHNLHIGSRREAQNSGASRRH